METPGSQTIRGDGQLFIMAGGTMINIMAGNGYPAINGDPLGLAGSTAVAIMAGRRYCRV